MAEWGMGLLGVTMNSAQVVKWLLNLKTTAVIA